MKDGGTAAVRAGAAGVMVALGAVLLAPGAAPAAEAAGAGSGPGPGAADPGSGSDSGSGDAAAAGEREADLVAGEDRRLTEALVAGVDAGHPGRTRTAYRVRSSGLFTLVLTRRKAPYTFDDLRRLASDTLVPQARNTFLLRENLVVAEGATLVIAPTHPLRIRLSSGPEGFVSLVTMGGRLRLNGTAAAPISMQSWDESHGRPDDDVTDGRAYVRASGQLVVNRTTFSRLGFWSGRTGGVSVVGSGTTPVTDIDAGAVSAAEDGDPGTENPSGRDDLLPAGKLPPPAQEPGLSYGTRISDSTMDGNAFGLFVTGSSGPRIDDTVIRNSVVDGLVLHRDVDSAAVSGVRVEDSGRDGVVVTRKVEGTTLTRLDVRGNGRDGVVLAGKPLAGGPSPSGQSTRPFGNNVLTASETADNARIGIHVIGGTAVRVLSNSVTGGRSGIVVSDGALDVDVDSNRVSGAHANGIQVRESRDVVITGNVVRDSPTGIHVRNSSGVLKQNATSGATLHGITFVGQVTGSVARQNLLAGSGTSAIDLVRVGPGSDAPGLADNDLSGWSRTVTSDSLTSLLLHPLTVIWIFVALLLLAMSRPRRGGPGLPYRADPLGRGGDVVLAGPPSVEPTREREIPVFAISDRHVPAPPAHAAAPSPTVVQLPDDYPLTRRAPSYRPADQTVPALRPPPPARRAVVAPELIDVTGGVPTLLPPPQSGPAVIDIAIREARLNPVPPRRRRVNDR